MSRAGWEPPLWLETTADDPGVGMCKQAVDEGCDGRLRLRRRRHRHGRGHGAGRAPTCRMAILPLGTGNLLARNLDLPLDDEAGSPAHRCPRRDPADRRRRDRGQAVRRDGRSRLRRGDHAGRPREAEENRWLAGVRRVWRQAPARPADQRHASRSTTASRSSAGCAPCSSATSASCRAASCCCPTPGPTTACSTSPCWRRATPSTGRGSPVGCCAARTCRTGGWNGSSGKHVVIEASRPQPRQLDGDLIEDGETMDIEIEAGALAVRVAR